jgi:hypothetical protein
MIEDYLKETQQPTEEMPLSPEATDVAFSLETKGGTETIGIIYEMLAEQGTDYVDAGVTQLKSYRLVEGVPQIKKIDEELVALGRKDTRIDQILLYPAAVAKNLAQKSRPIRRYLLLTEQKRIYNEAKRINPDASHILDQEVISFTPIGKKRFMQSA